ncbi:MAG: DUF58 domain-containing protein [Saprospiraceae bacterium]|nr:DUF58 domain-containing protein [Saprospiraceae bacterium]
METSELLKKVRKIEIKTKGISKELFSGEYHSAFKGRGMSFSEVRDYQYGDDVRNIEWNVTARTGHPHIKVFEEERELTVMLLVDISPSAGFGTQMYVRRDLITEISAVLAFSAINNNDKVGLILFGEQIELYIPPKKGKKHILRIIRELIDGRAMSESTNISHALEYFNNIVKKKSICFLLSDFFAPHFDQPLQIAARKHDIIGLHLYDPFEKSLPRAGLLQVMDAETGSRQIIDTSDKATRRHHETAFAEKEQRLNDLFKRCGADLISLESRESYILALHRFFKKRSH